jgi:hypothetical protein
VSEQKPRAIEQILAQEWTRIAGLSDAEFIKLLRSRVALQERILSGGLPAPAFIPLMIERVNAASDEELLYKRHNGIPLITPEEMGFA